MADTLGSRSQVLSNAIESLYEVFYRYPLPAFTSPCKCCHTEADVQRLCSRPLRELGAADLNQYAFDALLTWGDANLFRHFLPRIYELLPIPYGMEEHLPINEEILLSKLRHASWHAWPEHEQQAVRNYLHALWSVKRLGQASREFDFEEESETWLCTIAQAEDVLAQYLQEWLEDPDDVALENLAAFIHRSGILDQGAPKPNGFWENCSQQYQELQDWARSKQVRDILASKALSKGGEYSAASAMLNDLDE